MTEILRTMWRWPLYSSRRMLTVLAAAAVLICGLIALFSPSQVSRSAAGPLPAPGPGAASPAPGPTVTAAPSASVASKDLGAAIDTARSFVTAWATHSSSFQTWYAGAAVYATDSFAARLATVDPANIEPTAIQGTLRLTDTGHGRTEVAVPTNAGLVSVRLVQMPGGGWRVDDLRPGAQVEE